MKKVLAIILAIAIFMMAIPLSFSADTVADDNRVLFTPTVNESAVSYDADGKIYYQGYYTYGTNGLGYTTPNILRTYNNKNFSSSDGNAYLWAAEIDGETMWKIPVWCQC